jgi:hypothetical protein
MATTLLLTSTVNVGQCMNVVRKNSKDRENDYYTAINKFLTNTSLNLVWIDNSNADTTFLQPLKDKFPDRLETLVFDGNETSKTLGKGHSERETIKYGILNSRYRSETKYWIKVTGRVFIKDIDNVLNSIKANPDAVVWHAERNIRLNFVTSVVFVFQESFFWLFMDEPIDEKRYDGIFEFALYRAILKTNYQQIATFPRPIIDGISGSTNAKY